MNYKGNIVIRKSEMDLWNKLLSVSGNDSDDMVRELGYPCDSTISTFTAEFCNGYSADIKLCSGQSNFFGDAILFNKHGSEVNVLDCFDDLNAGDEFTFYEGADSYTVLIVKEEI